MTTFKRENNFAKDQSRLKVTTFKLIVMRGEGSFKVDDMSHAINIRDLKQAICDKFNEEYPDGMEKPTDWTSKEQIQLIKHEARRRGIDKDKQLIKEMIRELKKVELERRRQLRQPPLEVKQMLLKLCGKPLGHNDPDDPANDKLLKDYTNIKDGLIVHLIRTTTLQQTLIRQQETKENWFKKAPDKTAADDSLDKDQSVLTESDINSTKQQQDDVDPNETIVDFNESAIMEYEQRGKFKKKDMSRGLNLFGVCRREECKKKYFIKMGYGEFEFGKSREGQFDESVIVNQDLEDKEAKAHNSTMIDPDDPNIRPLDFTFQQEQKEQEEKERKENENAYRDELLKRLDNHDQYKQGYKRKKMREEAEAQKQLEEEQNKIQEQLANGLLGKMKENQAKLGIEPTPLDKSNKSVAKSAKSAKQEEDQKKKKKPERGRPMVARRLRAKQYCHECGQECYVFSNMRFYDCDFVIQGETITGKKFMKRGTTGRLLPKDDASFHSYVSNQVSRIPSLVQEQNIQELSKIMYTVDPKGKSFNNLPLGMNHDPDNELEFEEFEYLLSQQFKERSIWVSEPVEEEEGEDGEAGAAGENGEGSQNKNSGNQDKPGSKSQPKSGRPSQMQNLPPPSKSGAKEASRADKSQIKQDKSQINQSQMNKSQMNKSQMNKSNVSKPVTAKPATASVKPSQKPASGADAQKNALNASNAGSVLPEGGDSSDLIEAAAAEEEEAEEKKEAMFAGLAASLKQKVAERAEAERKKKEMADKMKEAMQKKVEEEKKKQEAAKLSALFAAKMAEKVEAQKREDIKNAQIALFNANFLAMIKKKIRDEELKVALNEELVRMVLEKQQEIIMVEHDRIIELVGESLLAQVKKIRVEIEFQMIMERFADQLVKITQKAILDLTLTDEERVDRVLILRFEQMEEINAWNWVKITVKERVAPGTKDEFELLMEQKAAEAEVMKSSQKQLSQQSNAGAFLFEEGSQQHKSVRSSQRSQKTKKSKTSNQILAFEDMEEQDEKPPAEESVRPSQKQSEKSRKSKEDKKSEAKQSQKQSETKSQKPSEKKPSDKASQKDKPASVKNEDGEKAKDAVKNKLAGGLAGLFKKK